MSEAVLRPYDTPKTPESQYWEIVDNECQLIDSVSKYNINMAEDADSKVARELRETSNPKSRVACYLRVSTKKQKVRSQVNELKDKVKAYLPHLDFYKDVRFYIDEGTSATKNTNLRDRDDGKRLVEDMNNGEIDYIFSKKVDRMFRDNEAGSAFVKWMTKKHPTVVFRTSDIAEPLNTPMGEMIFTIMVAQARFMAANLGVDTKDGMQTSQDNLERTSSEVYGWTWYDSGRRRIVQGKDKGPLYLNKPHWKEQDCRDWFMKEYENGKSVSNIRKRLNKWGVPNKSGNDWTDSALRNQINRPAKLHLQLDNPKHNFKRPSRRSTPPFRALTR
jgi:DNA invertase Pin-like site-specific DNA recombinase